MATIQRIATEVSSEVTVTTVSLPNDEMKGRIIGREGRNIRTLETLTGVDIIIDDTPEAVVISCFDPVRKEIARAVAGAPDLRRPHPPRAHRGGRAEGHQGDQPDDLRGGREASLFELGIHNMTPEGVRALGRLHYPDELRAERAGPLARRWP